MLSSKLISLDTQIRADTQRVDPGHVKPGPTCQKGSPSEDSHTWTQGNILYHISSVNRSHFTRDTPTQAWMLGARAELSYHMTMERVPCITDTQSLHEDTHTRENTGMDSESQS